MDLKDKRALITGGTSGMGIATGLAMAEKGATVILAGRDETRGAEEIRAGGHDAQFIAADLSDLSEVGRVAEEAGEIDVLVNLAGVAVLGPTADIDEAAFDSQLPHQRQGAARRAEEAKPVAGRHWEGRLCARV